MLYAADGNSNMAVTSNSTAMSLDGQLPSAIIQTLGQSFDGKSDNSKTPIAGLPGYGAIQPVQSSDENSLTDNSSPSNSFKLSPTSPIFNHFISPNDLGDAKNLADAPQTAGHETVVDGSNSEMNNMEDTTASKPRTRSSTGSLFRRRQTQPQIQAQTQTVKQKQQPAALKSKISLKKSKASNGGHKPQPRTRSLERNRIAASRCRQKKKERLSGLEAKKSKLEKQYKSLHSESNALLDEVTQLKNLLMTHAGCKDPNIDGWINNEANSYIRRLSQNAGPPGAAAAAAAATQADQNTFNGKSDLKFLSSSMVTNPSLQRHRASYVARFSGLRFPPVSGKWRILK